MPSRTKRKPLGSRKEELSTGLLFVVVVFFIIRFGLLLILAQHALEFSPVGANGNTHTCNGGNEKLDQDIEASSSLLYGLWNYIFE